MFDLKVLLLLGIFVYAFFRFTWSMRQYTFGALLIVEFRKGFHMSMTPRRIPALFLGPSHSKNMSRLASERSFPPNQMGLSRTRSLTTIRYV